MRERIEAGLKKRARFIIATHYFSDHLTALKMGAREGRAVERATV